MNRYAIRIRDLVKVYTLGSIEIQALRGLNLTVNHGDIVALIGPSGSGKSTLLNIIGGIDRATAGSIRVMGVDLTKLTPSQIVEFRRKQVGHLLQGENLMPTLTAAENVDLPMAAMGVKKSERRSRVMKLLGLVGLKDRMNHFPRELSGGEQQRVALASVLANDPPLIVVDEPTGDLDTENASVVTNYLVSISHELGRTVVMTTHDPRVARHADRILRMQDGVITVGVEPNVSMLLGGEAYVNYLKERISAIESELSQLGEDFRRNIIGSETYLERHESLKRMHDVFKDELQRLGFIR